MSLHLNGFNHVFVFPVQELYRAAYVVFFLWATDSHKGREYLLKES